MQKILVVLLLVCFTVSGIKAEEKKFDDGNYLNVNGNGKITIQPDIAEITLGFQADKITAADAQNQVSQKIASFLSLLKKIGVNSEEIKTVQNSLVPVRDYTSARPIHRITGYTATQKVRVRIVGESRLDLISRVIDLAAENNLNDIDNVYFEASSERLAEANRKVMALAAEDALRTGKEVFGRLNLKFKRIRNISLNAQPYYPVTYNNRSGMYTAAVQPKSSPEMQGSLALVMPGELVIEGNVFMSIEYE